MGRNNIDPYENLANAIVLKAAEDYRQALKDLERNDQDKNALSVKGECERFLKSGWFGVLTKLDGEWLMRKLRKEAGV